MRAQRTLGVVAPSSRKDVADERARDDGRRLPHLHVEREATPLARGSPGRVLHAGTRRHVPRDRSTDTRCGRTAPTASGRRWRSRTPTLTAVVAAGDAVFAGTDDARVLRLTPSGALEPLAGFDTVAGTRRVAPGRLPLQVRTMTATCDGAAVLVNVHVGGIPRSVDGGDTWQPTLAVDDDVHQVLAHPTRPEIVVAAASVGLCRSHDGGATWSSTTEGMDLTYARGVAFVGDDVVVTVSDGPWASRAAVYRASVDGGPRGAGHRRTRRVCTATSTRAASPATARSSRWPTATATCGVRPAGSTASSGSPTDSTASPA